jgi:uncharacterized membrane protein YraQ (UPF0718 family)
MENLNSLLITILEILASIAVAVLTGVVLPKVSSWLKAKTNSQVLNTAIDDLTQTVTTSVNYVEQTFVKQLKADGKWDADTQKEALTKAVDEVLVNLTYETVTSLQTNGNNIRDVVTRYVESTILEYNSTSDKGE